ncbi:glutamate-5-semialdehyde dehydrogenase [Prochlorothrix hollandica]|uniref:glutamate-5-semialdehyde dehydrogenase n=1 Tax=Prochlorothrix hollandica TaxID=1223 RepID=UPI0003497002|nr:glutamate-5-semialdehyde dehydrogenase [Prochlorothrix hollandica]
MTSVDSVQFNLESSLYQAYQASLVLGDLQGRDRSRALKHMAHALDSAKDEILEANTLDLEACEDMAVPDLIRDWLRLTPERLQGVVQMLEDLSVMVDPLEQGIATLSSGNGQTQAFTQLVPLGVVAFVYESLPALGAIAAGLCLRSGNSIILRGSADASQSNTAIAHALQRGLEAADLSPACITHLGAEQGSVLRDLLVKSQWVNLVIPYGRPSLVAKVEQSATAPVLKTGIGNCYLYWAASGQLDMVQWMIQDSYATEPDPVNAIEKVLINRDVSATMVRLLWESLKTAGFQVRVDQAFGTEPSDLETVDPAEWSQPYLSRTIAFRPVPSLDAAVQWINAHSSSHADCIATESYAESQEFCQKMNSATVYVNTSPRFCRNPSQSSQLALGMSNQKGHRRGPIGLTTLTTVKTIILGSGQVNP